MNEIIYTQNVTGQQLHQFNKCINHPTVRQKMRIYQTENYILNLLCQKSSEEFVKYFNRLIHEI